MTKNYSSLIISFLNELYPDAKCALDYSKDYELLIAVMLSAQTTDKAVNKVTPILFNKYQNLSSLKNASLDEVEDIIKFIGLYKNKAKNIIGIANRLCEENISSIPNDHDFLTTLPGVGRKTANVVLSELFNENLFAVDTHVARISKRLGIAKINDDPLTIEKKIYKYFKNVNLRLLNHQIITFGRDICNAKKPRCQECKLRAFCKEKHLK